MVDTNASHEKRHIVRMQWKIVGKARHILVKVDDVII